MKMIYWNVYHNGFRIDSVPYEKDCDSDYVRRSLIQHDGYPDNITVRKAGKRRKATA
jgi:hypothetical protein